MEACSFFFPSLDFSGALAYIERQKLWASLTSGRVLQKNLKFSFELWMRRIKIILNRIYKERSHLYVTFRCKGDLVLLLSYYVSFKEAYDNNIFRGIISEAWKK